MRKYKLWLSFIIGMSCAVLGMAALEWKAAGGLQDSTQEQEGSVLLPGSPAGTAFLGVEILQTSEGILVDRVMEDSPAGKGGIERGDVIIRYDSRKLEDISRLKEIASKSSPGDRVRIDVNRNGARKSFYVKLSVSKELNP